MQIVFLKRFVTLMTTYNPYHNLNIPYLAKKKREKFPHAEYTAKKYVVSENIHGRIIKEHPHVEESRRLLTLMFLAADLIRARPAQKQMSLFDASAEDVTKNVGQKFKKYVKTFPELHAHLDHFRLKLKEEKNRSTADYLNCCVSILTDNADYNLQKDSYVTPVAFTQNIVQLGQKTQNTMLKSLGEYFAHKLNKRQTRLNRNYLYMSAKQDPRASGPL